MNKKDLKGGEKMSKQIYAIRLEEETLESVRALAKQKKRSISNLLRLIIENYVEGQRI